jgi:AAHS family 4-hydroxybenzoate transporter-like MFS transporter
MSGPAGFYMALALPLAAALLAVTAIRTKHSVVDANLAAAH